MPKMESQCKFTVALQICASKSVWSLMKCLLLSLLVDAMGGFKCFQNHGMMPFLFGSLSF
jgi:hypothetical protein